MAFVDKPCRVATLVLLLFVGALPRTATTGRQSRQTKADKDLYLAAYHGDVHRAEEALKAGANIETQPNKQTLATPLLVATIYRHLHVLQLLIAHGANIEATSRGFTPLMLASHAGNLAIVLELLLAGAQVDRKTRKLPVTPLFIASERGYVNIVKLLVAKDANVNSRNRGGTPPIVVASQNGHLEVVRELLISGANPNLGAYDKKTALHLASTTLGKPSNRIVIALLDGGAKIDAVDDSGSTPLLLAAWFGNAGTTKILVERGANISWENNHGDTAFDLICNCKLAKKMKKSLRCTNRKCDDKDHKMKLADLLLPKEFVESVESQELTMLDIQDESLNMVSSIFNNFWLVFAVIFLVVLVRNGNVFS